jgi:magnesium transporter
VIYVVDDGWRLLDDMPIRRLVIAEPEQRVEEIMDHTLVRLEATDDREEAVRSMRRFDRVALPVVDSDGVLVGIVTVDDVFDVAQEEATEDFHRAGAMVPLRTSYWEATRFVLYRARIGWLAALVLINLVSSGVIAAYEEVSRPWSRSAFFIPLIIDTGGNTGSQSATMMIRAISTGDVKPSAVVQGVHQGARRSASPSASPWACSGMLLGFFSGGFEVGHRRAPHHGHDAGAHQPRRVCCCRSSSPASGSTRRSPAAR